MRGPVRIMQFAVRAALIVLLLGVALLFALPHVSPYDVLVVRGGSMEPAIHVGSIVVVDRSDRAPQVAAVMTFRDPVAGIVTHRVVAVGPSSFQTKGDANDGADVTPRSSSDVIGTVRFDVPGLGYLLYLVEQPVVFLGLLAAVIGSLIVSELRSIASEIRRMRRARSGEAPLDA